MSGSLDSSNSSFDDVGLDVSRFEAVNDRSPSKEKRFTSSPTLAGEDPTNSSTEEEGGGDNLYDIVFENNDFPVNKFEAGNCLPPVGSVHSSDRFARRRGKLFWYLFAFAQIIVIIGLSVGLAKRGKSNSSSASNESLRNQLPGASQGTRPSVSEVKQFLTKMGVDPGFLNIEGRPQNFGMLWLVNQDHQALSLPSSNDGKDAYQYLARYVMAVSFFSMARDEPWDDSLNFLSPAPVCEWNESVEGGSRRKGLSCDNQGNPISLVLNNNGLTGEIPPELGLLTTLLDIDVSGNELEGTVPEELCNLVSLESLYLDDNDFDGESPDCFADMTIEPSEEDPEDSPSGKPGLPEIYRFLEGMGVARESLDKMDGAQYKGMIWLAEMDHLSLPIPQASDPYYGQHAYMYLTRYVMAVCFFSMTMEEPWDETLNFLSPAMVCAWNAVTGEGDGGYRSGLLCDAEGFPIYLFLANNGLSGELPPELGLLDTLQGIDFSDNDMSGQIPTEFGRLDSLEDLDLSDNDFTGNIPTEFGLLDSLENLDLSDNELEGTVPEELCNLDFLDTFFLGGNLIEGTALDCFDDVTLEPGPQDDTSSGPGLGRPSYYEMREFLIKMGMDEFLLDSDRTPQHSALSWLVEMDEHPLSLPQESHATYAVESERILLRYAVVVAFFSLAVENPWEDNLNFLSPAPVCDWNDSVDVGGTFQEKGLFCDDEGNPVRLILAKNGLSGTIPPEIALLGTLELLDLSGNDIEGFLPPELCLLGSLEGLYLGDNELEGTVLKCIGDLAGLQVLQLSDNHFEGNLPIELTKLESLELLMLEKNDFEGSELIFIVENLTLLRWLVAGSNSFSGFIQPKMFENLKLIEKVDLSDNSIMGSYSFFFEMANLAYLDLSFNNFQESLPSEISLNTNLEYLDLQGNGLTGNIPEAIASLTGLAYLSLSINAFEGPLPATIGSMKNLEKLYLANLQLLEEGPIPFDFTKLTLLEDLSLRNSNRMDLLPGLIMQENLRYLDLANNKFYGSIPDPWGDLVDLKVLILSGNAGIVGGLPDSFEKLNDLEVLLLDGTGLTGDLEFMCDAMNVASPDEVAIRVNCDADGFEECPCCTCCEEHEEICSQSILAELDDQWEVFLRAMDNFSLYK